MDQTYRQITKDELKYLSNKETWNNWRDETEHEYIMLEDCNFDGLDVSFYHFMNVHLKNCSFIGAALMETNFRMSKMEECQFWDTIFYKTPFENCDLRTCTFNYMPINCYTNGCIITPEQYKSFKDVLSRIHITDKGKPIHVSDEDSLSMHKGLPRHITGEELAYLSDKDRWNNWRKAGNFENILISDMDFDERNLSYINFKNVYLKSCSFRKAVLIGTDFRFSNFERCSLADALFYKTYIENCDLRSCFLNDLPVNCHTDGCIISPRQYKILMKLIGNIVVMEKDALIPEKQLKGV